MVIQKKPEETVEKESSGGSGTTHGTHETTDSLHRDAAAKADGEGEGETYGNES